MDFEEFIYALLDAEPAVFGGAVINSNAELEYQTENWEISADVAQLMGTANEAKKDDGKNPGSLSIMKLKYMIVEFTPERVIATNVSRKGHIILAPIESGGALVAYIDPNKGPRDALFNVQKFCSKIERETLKEKLQ